MIGSCRSKIHPLIDVAQKVISLWPGQRAILHGVTVDSHAQVEVTGAHNEYRPRPSPPLCHRHPCMYFRLFPAFLPSTPLRKTPCVFYAKNECHQLTYVRRHPTRSSLWLSISGALGHFFVSFFSILLFVSLLLINFFHIDLVTFNLSITPYKNDTLFIYSK